MYLKYKYCLFSITKLNKFNTFLDLGENSRTLLAILVIPLDPLLFRDRGPFASAHDLSLLRFYALDAFILVLFSYAPLDFPSTLIYKSSLLLIVIGDYFKIINFDITNLDKYNILLGVL